MAGRSPSPGLGWLAFLGGLGLLVLVLDWLS